MVLRPFEDLKQMIITGDHTKLPVIDPMLDFLEMIFHYILPPENLILLVANMILERLDVFEGYHPSETWVRERAMYLISIAHNHYELATLSSEFPEFDYDTPGSNTLVSACMLLWVGASQIFVRCHRLTEAVALIYSTILEIHEEKRNRVLWRAWRSAALAEAAAVNTDVEMDETLAERVFSLQAQIAAETDSDAEEINLAWQFWQTLIERIEPLLVSDFD